MTRQVGETFDDAARRFLQAAGSRRSALKLLAGGVLAVTLGRHSTRQAAAEQSYGVIGSYYLENPICGGDQYFARGGRYVTVTAPVVRPVQGWDSQWVAYRARLHWDVGGQVQTADGAWSFAETRADRPRGQSVHDREWPETIFTVNGPGAYLATLDIAWFTADGANAGMVTGITAPTPVCTYYQ